MKSLLIGCGNDRTKKVFRNGQEQWAGELTTIDMHESCNPTMVLDMSIYHGHMPFDDDTFHEIGAFDSLEHWGRQGDWKSWFAEMAEYHRILKVGGTMGIIVPIGPDALADPGHVRFFSANYFHMLNQQWYADQLAKGMPVTDYRFYWKANFNILHMENIGGHHFAVLLEKTL